MSPVIAIFGAGTGLGASLAHRFGREGFRVALVARRPGRLEELTRSLASKGIEAAAFPADLADPAGIPALVARIQDHFGRIDVVEYSPVTMMAMPQPATELTADRLGELLNLFTLTPVEITRAVLPAMTARGDGAILVTHGLTAARPVPGMGGLGSAMAATRNYLYALHGEVAPLGVYVGTLTIGSVIAGSEGHDSFAGAPLPSGITVVEPDRLADIYWNMYRDRDRVEEFWPPDAA
ncbi:SDR family NAD(P)-dependent oxidoreductase [Streptomyces sp. NBC_01433]|uniref:SDR family NAD(P)-dependent oxidoreductase n=1 Tax=Streptomyces sp. NBC_01433 TaxID=2903864 RepID=UPI00224D4115|nr:SDR family NAD(P)-dependent oxidoreductase [Streptomyces sp. NBC_01433]MCX4680300.1 SDR family NAD(P)-dependent oxidoreductase [Streptomyces sp. NBC_01433]